MPFPKEILEGLKERQQILEQPFVSTAPIVGPLIVWIRTQWNDIATRWYVRPLLQQQNEFNQRLVNALEGIENAIEVYADDAREHLEVLETSLIELDHDQTTTVRDLAEARYQITRLRRDLDALEGTPPDPGKVPEATSC